MSDASGEWSEYKRLVLSELGRIDDKTNSVSTELKVTIKDVEITLIKKIETLQSTYQITRDDVTALKIKAGVWGLLGGLVPAAITILISLAKG